MWMKVQDPYKKNNNTWAQNSKVWLFTLLPLHFYIGSFFDYVHPYKDATLQLNHT